MANGGVSSASCRTLSMRLGCNRIRRQMQFVSLPLKRVLGGE